jgi:hypothetical protein
VPTSIKNPSHTPHTHTRINTASINNHTQGTLYQTYHFSQISKLPLDVTIIHYAFVVVLFLHPLLIESLHLCPHTHLLLHIYHPHLLTLPHTLHLIIDITPHNSYIIILTLAILKTLLNPPHSTFTFGKSVSIASKNILQPIAQENTSSNTKLTKAPTLEQDNLKSHRQMEPPFTPLTSIFPPPHHSFPFCLSFSHLKLCINQHLLLLLYPLISLIHFKTSDSYYNTITPFSLPSIK